MHITILHYSAGMKQNRPRIENCNLTLRCPGLNSVIEHSLSWTGPKYIGSINPSQFSLFDVISSLKLMVVWSVWVFLLTCQRMENKLIFQRVRGWRPSYFQNIHFEQKWYIMGLVIFLHSKIVYVYEDRLRSLIGKLHFSFQLRLLNLLFW